MANTYKVLAQVFPTRLTLTDWYTVPAATSAIISTLMIANSGSTLTDAVRVAVAVAGTADDIKQYLYYNITIAPNTSFAATIGLTLAATDVIRVYSTAGVSSFNLFGQEIT